MGCRSAFSAIPGTNYLYTAYAHTSSINSFWTRCFSFRALCGIWGEMSLFDNLCAVCCASFYFSSLYFTSAILFLLVGAFYFTIYFCFVLFYFLIFFLAAGASSERDSDWLLFSFSPHLILLCFCFAFALFLLYFCFIFFIPSSPPHYRDTFFRILFFSYQLGCSACFQLTFLGLHFLAWKIICGHTWHVKKHGCLTYRKLHCDMWHR